MNQKEQRESVRQEQPAKTSTVICGVQPHATEAVAPRAGMRIKMSNGFVRDQFGLNPFVFDTMECGSEVFTLGNSVIRVIQHNQSFTKAHLSWDKKYTPIRDYISRNTNMTIGFGATEEQLWNMTRPAIDKDKSHDNGGFDSFTTVPVRLSRDGEGRIVVFHGDEPTPEESVEEEEDACVPFIPYKQKRGRKKKKDGVDHLKERMDKKTKKWSTAKGGLKAPLQARRLAAAMRKLGPDVYIPAKKERVVPKGEEQMRQGTVQPEVSHEDWLHELAVFHGRWEDAGIVRKLVALELATRCKRNYSSNGQFRTDCEASRGLVLSHVTRLCRSMGRNNIAWVQDLNVSIMEESMKWLKLVTQSAREREVFCSIFSATAQLEVLDTFVIQTLANDGWWRGLRNGVKFQIPPHAPEDYYGPYVFRWVSRLARQPVNPRHILDILNGLLWKTRPRSFENAPWLSDFTPAGAGAHWEHGGKELLIARAVLWGVVGQRPNIEDGHKPSDDEIYRSIAIMNGEKGLVVGFLVAAVANSFEHCLTRHMGMAVPFEEAVVLAGPDFYADWVRKVVMSRPEEYSTLLETLLGTHVPQWDRIEPILRAMFTGWLASRAFDENTPTRTRVSFMMAAFMAFYTEHTLASRTFGALSAKFQAIVKGCFEKLFYVLDEVWRRLSRPNREQSFSGDVMDWLAQVFSVVDKQMFSKIMEAVALIGSVFTCPFPNIEEGQMVKWANDLLTNLSNSMGAAMKKLSFIEKLWELGKFFFTRARLAWVNRDPMMFLYGRDEFVTLTDKVNILFNVTKSLSLMTDVRAQCIVDGVPYSLDTYKQLMAEINVTVKQIQGDLKKGVIRELPSFVSLAFSRFAACCEELEAFEKTQRNRPLPFALFLVGPPSAGKNSLLEDMIKTIFDLVEFPAPLYEQNGGEVPRFVGFDRRKLDPVVYTKNAFDEYDSGYANRCNVISFIETGCFNTAYTKGAEQSFNQLASLMSYLDTAPYSPVMADVDSKGRMSASGIQLAVLSANNIDLHKDIMRDQMALARRLGKAIRLEVKPNFRDSVTTGLDKSKVRNTEYKMDDDMWIYTVLTPVASETWDLGKPTTAVEWVVDDSVGIDGKFYTNRDFTEWLISRIRNHVEEQMRIMVQSSKSTVAVTCGKCMRRNHCDADHCPQCGGVSHTSSSLDECANYYATVSQSNVTCNLCKKPTSPGCFTPGCAACDERDWANKAVALANELSSKLQDNGWGATNVQSLIKETEIPCFCHSCYRPMKGHVFSPVKCYGCSTTGEHTYMRQVLYHLSAALIAEGKAPLDSGDPMALVDAHPALRLLKTNRRAHMYQRGCEQMKVSEAAAIALCGAAVGAVGMYCWRPKVSVQVGFVGEAERSLAAANNIVDGVQGGVAGIRRSFSERFASVVPIAAFSEGEWFLWAKRCVVGLTNVLSSFSLKAWITFAGLATLVMTVCRVFMPTIEVNASARIAGERRHVVAVVKPGWGGVYLHTFKYPCLFMQERRGCEQMRVFDAEFVASILSSHGVSSGARASYPSAVKIDNPWLSQPMLKIRENIGKRAADRGVEQCNIAVTRIERSIYKMASVPVHTTDEGRISELDLSVGTHVHCMLLHGSLFVVNTHFLVQTIISQYQISRRNGVSDEDIDRISEEMADCLDWDSLISLARANGVRSVWICVGMKFRDSSCEGITTQQWEKVDLINIVGNIYQDVALVRLNRFVGPSKTGLVRRGGDLGSSLLVPREHTAPTDCVLVDREMDGITGNCGVALFRQNISFSVHFMGKEREKPLDAWSIPIDKRTEDGDCGLPLVGVWHTKYKRKENDDADTKEVDVSGDVVCVLGMHRIYQVSARIAHCAPLSIDIISALWGKLDKQQEVEEQNWKLYTIPSYGAGVVPSHIPKIDYSRPLEAGFEAESLNTVQYTDIVFKRGSCNEYHDKSPIQWMGKGETLPYAPDLGVARALLGCSVGSVSGFRQGMFKSGVSRLPTANWFGYEQRHFVPNLNDRRGKEMNLVAMSGATDGDLDYSLLRRVANDMVLETIELLDAVNPKWREAVHPLTDVETVGGSNLVNFTPPVNRSTGMGFPFYGSKDPHLLVDRDSYGSPQSVLVRDEVLADIKRHIDAYENMERANPVFTATPKDERIGASKIVPVYGVNGEHLCDAHNLRIFLCGSYSFVHLQRQQFMSAIRLICDYPEVFEMAVGTNVCSRRWGLMGEWLSWWGEAQSTVLAGDYSKYDKRMTATWIKVAFEVLISLLVESGGYTEGDLRIASGIALDTASPLIDWFGDWFFVTNGHPSGHALTTIINGIVNRLYLRYAYYILWRTAHPLLEWEMCRYRECVRTYVYGDDNISGVRGEARAFFTMPNVSRVLRGVGVILTTEDKADIVDDFTSLAKASFLKRKWVECDGRVTAPLALKSLEAMVTVGVLNTTQTTTQMFQLLRSYCDEFFHYGRDKHEEHREKCLALCLDEEYWVREGFPLVGIALRAEVLRDPDSIFPSYDKLVDRWENAGFVPMY